MKSREAIRNKILRYANLTWNAQQMNNLNPLIHLLIEETCNELFLLDNKLSDIDFTILEKLVHNLIPTGFSFVRPAHGILHIKPEIPLFNLSCDGEFLMKEIPTNLKGRVAVSPAFTPVTDVTLINGSVKHLFFDRTLWMADSDGSKIVISRTNRKAAHNTLWIQLEHHTAIKEIKDLCLYLDFPHLNDNHDYYELLSELKWSYAGKELHVTPGIPLNIDKKSSPSEQAVLDHYQKRYWTIFGTLYANEKSTAIPVELQSVLDEEIVRSLPSGIWLSIKFPAHFLQEDISKADLLMNTFPVINRRYNNHRLSLEEFTGITALPSEPGEEFLEIETVKDSSRYIYKQDEIVTHEKKGFFSIEPVRKRSFNDSRIYDYLERFIDTLQSEKAVFPYLDEEQIQFVLNRLSDILDKENQKQGLNTLNEYAEVARLAISAQPEIDSLEAEYWTSLADRLNGLSKGTAMMASKIPALNKSDAVLLTNVAGGRTFYDSESLKAINRFYLVSRGKIITKYNIISFCDIEAGAYCSHIDVVRKTRISPKSKEGIINVMEVQLTPKTQFTDYFKEKGILSDLKIRLSKQSPPHYRYIIKVMESNHMTIEDSLPLFLTKSMNKD